MFKKESRGSTFLFFEVKKKEYVTHIPFFPLLRFSLAYSFFDVIRI